MDSEESVLGGASLPGLGSNSGRYSLAGNLEQIPTEWQLWRVPETMHGLCHRPTPTASHGKDNCGTIGRGDSAHPHREAR